MWWALMLAPYSCKSSSARFFVRATTVTLYWLWRLLPFFKAMKIQPLK